MIRSVLDSVAAGAAGLYAMGAKAAVASPEAVIAGLALYESPYVDAESRFAEYGALVVLLLRCCVFTLIAAFSNLEMTGLMVSSLP